MAILSGRRLAGAHAAKDVHVSIEWGSSGPSPTLDLAGTVVFESGRVTVDLAASMREPLRALDYNGVYRLENAGACDAPPASI